MQVTNEWLEKNRTRAGGYTRAQLQCLGVEWPPAQGWKRAVAGAVIPDDLARRFEAAVAGNRGRNHAHRKDEMNTKIWTDGSCWPNPGGAGGWAWHDGASAQGTGGAASTTNNRMELTAILEALRAQPAGAAVTIYSDSQYCVNGLTVWSKGWARRDWMKKGEPMPNRDLWLALECEKRRVQATFLWVRGHAGDAGNERADQLAEAARIAATLN